MAILKVQGPLTFSGTGGATNAVKAYGSAVTAGNFLIAYYELAGTGATLSCSDSVNGAWTKLSSESGNGVQGAIFYFSSTAAGTPTVTGSRTGGSGNGFDEITIFEFSGIASASFTDGSTGATGSTAAPASGSITTLNANDLIFGGAQTAGSGITAGTASWTGAVTGNGGWVQYFIVSSATGYNATFTSSNAGWVASVAAFKAAGVTQYRPNLVAVSNSSNSTTVIYQPYRPTLIASSASTKTLINGHISLVQHATFGMDQTAFTGTVTFPFPNATLGGNLLICSVQFNSAGSIASVKDNQGNSFTLGPTFTGSSKTGAIYYLPNCASGSTSVKVVFSGFSATPGYPNAVISEWYNIAPQSPVDGTSVSSNNAVSLGAITTTSAGDLIYQWGIDLSDNGSGPAFNGTSITVGSGFTLLSADLQVGVCEQYQIQTSPGAISPAFTHSGSATWGSCAMAFKSGFSGAQPDPHAMRIVGVYHCSMAGVVNSPFGLQLNNLQFPCTGNLLVGLYQGSQSAGLGTITAASDNLNTWTIQAGLLESGSGGTQVSQVIYAANASSSPNLHSLILTFSGTPTYAFICLYDVVNAAPSPYDSASVALNFGTSTTNTNLNFVPSITPSTPSGIVFALLCVDYNTPSGLTTPATYIMDAAVNSLDANNIGGSAATGASSLEEDAVYAHSYVTSKSALSFTCTGQFAAGGSESGFQIWTSVAVAFKACYRPFPVLLSNSVSSLTDRSVYRSSPSPDSNSSSVVNPEYRYFPKPSAVTSSLARASYEVVNFARPFLPGASASLSTIVVRYLYRSGFVPVSNSGGTTNSRYAYRSQFSSISSSSESVIIREIYRSLMAASSNSLDTIVPFYVYRPDPQMNSGSSSNTRYELGATKYRPFQSLTPWLTASVALINPRYVYHPDPVILGKSIMYQNVEMTYRSLFNSVSNSIDISQPQEVYRSNPGMLSGSSSYYNYEVNQFTRPHFPSSSSTAAAIIPRYILRYLFNILSNSSSNINDKTVYRSLFDASSISTFPEIVEIIVAGVSSSSAIFNPEYLFRPDLSAGVMSSSVVIPNFTASNMYRPKPILLSLSLLVANDRSVFRSFPHSISTSSDAINEEYLYRSKPSPTASSSSIAHGEFILSQLLTAVSTSSDAMHPEYAYRSNPVVKSGSSSATFVEVGGSHRPDFPGLSTSIMLVNPRYMYRSPFSSSSASSDSITTEHTYRSLLSAISKSSGVINKEYLFRPDPYMSSGSSSAAVYGVAGPYHPDLIGSSKSLSTIIVRYLFRPDLVSSSASSSTIKAENLYRSSFASDSNSLTVIHPEYEFRPNPHMGSGSNVNWILPFSQVQFDLVALSQSSCTFVPRYFNGGGNDLTVQSVTIRPPNTIIIVLG